MATTFPETEAAIRATVRRVGERMQANPSAEEMFVLARELRSARLALRRLRQSPNGSQHNVGDDGSGDHQVGAE